MTVLSLNYITDIFTNMGLTNGDSKAELQVLVLQMDIGCFEVSLFKSTLEIITVVSYCKSPSKKKPVSIRHPVFAGPS